MARIPQRSKNRPGHGDPRGRIVLLSRLDDSELGLASVPQEPEYRGSSVVSPAPDVSMEDAVAEMMANDEEAREWRSSEILADLFAKGRR